MLQAYKNSFSRAKQIKTEFCIAQEANLRLAARQVQGKGRNVWAALAAANEKVGKFSERHLLVSLYNHARTYFIKHT